MNEKKKWVNVLQKLGSSLHVIFRHKSPWMVPGPMYMWGIRKSLISFLIFKINIEGSIFSPYPLVGCSV